MGGIANARRQRYIWCESEKEEGEMVSRGRSEAVHEFLGAREEMVRNQFAKCPSLGHVSYYKGPDMVPSIPVRTTDGS